MIKVYYGLSGTFKTTTIQRELKKYPKLSCVKSEIKTWKKYQNELFGTLLEPNDLNFALLHLCVLSHEVEENHPGLLVERGITDMLYYRRRLCPSEITPALCIEAVNKEIEVMKNESVQKILLYQGDIDFVRDVILKEPTRAQVFPGGVEEYMKVQEDYVKFTKEYNMITEEIKINNAKGYLGI